MTVRNRKSTFAPSPGDREARNRNPEDRTGKAERFTARMTIGVAPELRVLIKVSAVQGELIVAESPRNLRAREFP